MKKLTLKNLKKLQPEILYKAHYLKYNKIKIEYDKDKRLVGSNENPRGFEAEKFEFSSIENDNNYDYDKNASKIIYVKSDAMENLHLSHNTENDVGDPVEQIQNITFKITENLSTKQKEQQGDAHSDIENKYFPVLKENAFKITNDDYELKILDVTSGTTIKQEVDEASFSEDDNIIIIVGNTKYIDSCTESRLAADIGGNERGSIIRNSNIEESVINKLQALLNKNETFRENECVDKVNKEPYVDIPGKTYKYGTKNGPFLCDMCGQFKYSMSNFRSHLRHHREIKENLKKHGCSICRKAFNLRESVWMHTLKVHNKDKITFICSLCGRKSFSKEHVLACEGSHRLPVDAGVPSPFRCHCGKSYLSKHKLSEHESRMHRPVMCTQCFLTSPSLYDLNIHRQKVHSKNKKVAQRPYRPPKTTKRNSYNPQKMLTCPICDKNLCDYFSLNYHLKQRHRVFNPSTKKLINCNSCDKSYMKFGTYINHKKKVHSEQVLASEILAINETMPLSNPEVSCPMCGQTLKSKLSLRNHKYFCRATTSDFACGLCNSIFNGWKEYRTHRSTAHTVEEQRSCHVCLKRFKNYRCLWNHRFVHVSAEHRCAMCASIFKRKGDCLRHMRDKHGLGMQPSD